jgi:hypothetical protein
VILVVALGAGAWWYTSLPPVLKPAAAPAEAEDNRVRITAQLIDATTGNHVWSERYDRPLMKSSPCRTKSRSKSSGRWVDGGAA